jgi:hypothetical protein
MSHNYRYSVITLTLLLGATFKVDAGSPKNDCDMVSKGQVACDLLSGNAEISSPGLFLGKPRHLVIGLPSNKNNYSAIGQIDDVMIYRRALSGSEEEALYKVSNENRLTVTKIGHGRGTFQAKIKGEPWNMVCKSDCSKASQIYPVDSQVILFARSEKGFVLNGWGGDCSSPERRIKLTMDTAKNCTVQFEPDNRQTALLTIDTWGNGQGTVISKHGYINCGADCSAYYLLNRQVLLEATPNPGSLFIGWSDDCIGTKSRVLVTMDAAKSCIATFIKPML